MAGIIRIGRLLTDAKAALPHGEFGAMVKEDLPFQPTTAKYLRQIAGNTVLSNGHYSDHLPADWYTLSLLAPVDPERLAGC